MKSIFKNLYKILLLMASSFNSTANFLDHLLKLAIRCAIAKIILTSGIEKFDELAELFLNNTNQGIEFSREDIYEFLRVLAEITVGVMLVTGLGTRYVAAGLLVIIFYYNQLSEYKYESIILASLLTAGAGKVSIDYYIASKDDD